jgi:hypothetical protein
MALGVLDPVLNDVHQLLQKHQRPLVAAHQRLLGQVYRRWIVLAIGQPAIQGARQVAVEVAHRIGQLRFVVLQTGLQQGAVSVSTSLIARTRKWSVLPLKRARRISSPLAATRG